MPQALEIKLEERAEIAHIVLLNKPDMDVATQLQIYIGDAKEDSIGRIESGGIKYRLAGQVMGKEMPRSDKPTQIECLGIG